MPNNFPMNRACPTQSPRATHRTLPLRIRLTASMPCNVRHALWNEPSIAIRLLHFTVR